MLADGAPFGALCPWTPSPEDYDALTFLDLLSALFPLVAESR